MDAQKPIHTLVLDTGAIIKNDPSVSTLIANSESLVTVPAIISEIRDAATRSRVEVTLKPFLTIRSPGPASVKFVTDFARRTGDLAVLSKPDIQIIALTYEIECERNSGDWRLRRVPGQKGLNGAPPAKPGSVATEDVPTETLEESANASERAHDETQGGEQTTEAPETSPEDPSTLTMLPEKSANASEPAQEEIQGGEQTTDAPETSSEDPSTLTVLPNQASPDSEPQPTEQSAETLQSEPDLSDAAASMTLNDAPESNVIDGPAKVDSAQNSASSHEDSASDSEGWITPSNLKKRQAQDLSASTVSTHEQKTMQVAVLTTDFAMQNVILQMNLNLLSASMTRVKHLKTFVLRCHACFQVTKDMTKQFCPKCGQPTLTRVSCSTSANGEFKLHLKKNMQWNTRGDRYSIPKAVHGSSNGRIQGGGKGGWGNDLILAEDQKEYERASTVERRQKERSLMDEDYLPSILTGDRGRTGGRTKVGAGRNVNAKKR
ncbi:hypothetical protein LTR36_004399 [Oleoguttula mirabilis]|uniref:20S-pre-rRNA D-site endonuclease NOB1 n=1 Tax=Oleoguttula mirabilis TaxID=1507867 RepID=A0AAV9JGJ0_9PEZI|nr:hypothetical protein LTR36_004399 [Oleoguttula mirabilis]